MYVISDHEKTVAFLADFVVEVYAGSLSHSLVLCPILVWAHGIDIASFGVKCVLELPEPHQCHMTFVWTEDN